MSVIFSITEIPNKLQRDANSSIWQHASTLLKINGVYKSKCLSLTPAYMLQILCFSLNPIALLSRCLMVKKHSSLNCFVHSDFVFKWLNSFEYCWRQCTSTGIINSHCIWHMFLQICINLIQILIQALNNV